MEQCAHLNIIRILFIDLPRIFFITMVVVGTTFSRNRNINTYSTTNKLLNINNFPAKESIYWCNGRKFFFSFCNNITNISKINVIIQIISNKNIMYTLFLKRKK